MAIVDVITFNGENELFDLRYNILKDYVDEFIVVEFPTTFSGKPKPYYFEAIKGQYDKVRYYPMLEDYSPLERAIAHDSPNTQYGKGASHWVHEFLQKERISRAIQHLNDDDIVFIGDCDEIWMPPALFPMQAAKDTILKLRLQVYTYYLNNASTEEFYGTVVGKYRFFKGRILNHIRSDKIYHTKRYSNKHTPFYLYGWHFTSLKDQLQRKLTDSYTDESYATLQVMENLNSNIAANKDFLGRNFTYKKDERLWPQYLKDNRAKYAHLCLP